MSERTFSGLIDVADTGPTGMITLRASLANPGIRQALASAGFDVPGQGEKAGDALWMSPDEVMVLTDYDHVEARCEALRAALTGHHRLVANVSDARVRFRLSGRAEHIREVLAKLSPADLRETSLPVGKVRRTRLAQVAAAFWFTSENEAELICFRSVGDYVFGLLTNAAAENTEVGYF